MSVRYANFISLQPGQSVEVFANRGTSGIDGSNGTALGAALATDKLVTLLTGDMAFLYDRNSLWHNYLPKNLRIIVLNNHGGGIFRLLDGPASQPELEDYFATRQSNKAELTARDAGLHYFYAHTLDELQKQLTAFFDLSDSAKLLEIETDPKINAEVFARFKSMFK
jgi:2-succinyl-5-enolpyruvyl-6-hydroxy-3-cyclohexene-1-carboxylate synthase